MNKQEEILEGLKGTLLFEMKLVSPMAPAELEFNVNELAKKVLGDLHSQGAVIKVEDDSLHYIEIEGMLYPVYKDGSKGNLVAVEPLIEVTKIIGETEDGTKFNMTPPSLNEREE